MKVRELIRLLKKQDPDALVGCSLSYRCGFVNGVARVGLAPDGTVCIDQEEETIFVDEVKISFKKGGL
jgi:hypothetical protein